jgi:hypothetical protein
MRPRYDADGHIFIFIFFEKDKEVSVEHMLQRANSFLEPRFKKGNEGSAEEPRTIWSNFMAS